MNIVTSSDHSVGEILSTSPDVDMVAFTGSTATGKRIMAAASGTLKSTFLELGGKSANIILDDADFPSAVGTAAAVCTHGGQGCAISTRLLVPRSRYQEAVDIVTEGMKNIGYGDPPNDPSNLQGATGIQASAGEGAELHREGQGRRRETCRRRRDSCPSAQGGTSSNRPYSSMSTTR